MFRTHKVERIDLLSSKLVLQLLERCFDYTKSDADWQGLIEPSALVPLFHQVIRVGEAVEISEAVYTFSYFAPYS